MKALVIRQPWASLIAHGLKKIETRTWRTHFRGRLLIVAGKTIDTEAMARHGIRRIGEGIDTPFVVPFQPDDFNIITEPGGVCSLFPTGVAVATARIVDCRPYVPADEAGAMCLAPLGAWSWVLADIQRVKPTPVRGMPGLFHVREGAIV